MGSKYVARLRAVQARQGAHEAKRAALRSHARLDFAEEPRPEARRGGDYIETG